MFNTARRINNYFIQQIRETCEAKTDRIEGRNTSSAIIVWDFNTAISMIARMTKQKICKEIEDLAHNKPARPNTPQQNTLSRNNEYPIFSRVHGAFSRIDHMSGQKLSLNRF